MRTHSELFSRIYRKDRWRVGDSASGRGSTRERGAMFAPAVAELLSDLRIRTLLDAPCGDFNWAGLLADAVEAYIGVDVVADLIARNSRQYGGGNRTFVVADLTRDPLPRSDLVLCRDCLVHFPFADIWATLANFKRSGAEYLLTTTFTGRTANRDIRLGRWRPLNLEAAPFHFPPPLAVVDEQCTHSGGIYRDKRLALWRMEAVPGSAL